MKKNKTIILVFSVLICICLAGCNKDEKNELKNKVVSELEYVSFKVIDMLNALNNLSFENYTLVFEQEKIDDKNQVQESEQNNNS